MIIIPLNTDAPIYHWPWMSLVLVAANCVTFFVTGFGEDLEGGLLQFGNGLHPVEWVTCNFLHAGWLHLIGNMIFLWGFGIVVEGKLGWWRFLLVYLLIGALGGAMIQTLSLRHVDELASRSGGGGSSLIVYGLLALCMFWAPKNEMDVFVYFGFRPMTFEVSNFTFGIWYLIEQVIFAWWDGSPLGSSFGNLIGAFWGLGIGFAMLRLGWVDCENWDLLAIWDGRFGQSADFSPWQNDVVVTHTSNLRDQQASVPIQKKKAVFRPSIYMSSKQSKRRKPANAEQPEVAAPDTKRSMSESSLPPATLKVLDRMRELIRAEKPQAALGEYHKRLRIVDHWPLDADDLLALADGMFKLKNWDEAIPLLEEFVKRFPARADAARIKLAAVFCEAKTRPRAALKLLDEVELDDLPDSIRGYIAQIRQKAEGMLGDDTFELDGKNW